LPNVLYLLQVKKLADVNGVMECGKTFRENGKEPRGRLKKGWDGAYHP